MSKRTASEQLTETDVAGRVAGLPEGARIGSSPHYGAYIKPGVLLFENRDARSRSAGAFP
ncbi:hypothetical protein BG61_06235 [Caballeronia glathei]|uniref:Uncharacterized protein n=1 Tax=Caballeronia glathei TaxID=60547 RepID=A0A069PQ37_9BURK|nr:hypothetical protein BG61_06235 [Caballeronia glathei]